jgi:(2Fe-2S) ferredoxin
VKPGAKRYRVVVCRGPECGERRGSAALHESFLRHARALGMENQIEMGWQACFGRCRQGPNVLVRIAPATPPRTLLATPPSGPGQNVALYNGVRAHPGEDGVDDVLKILQSHVGRGIIVRELVLRPDAYHPPAVPPNRAEGSEQAEPAMPATEATTLPKNVPNDKETGGEPK